MIRGFLVLAFIVAAAGLAGVGDRSSFEVAHQAALEAPRPIFESAADLQRLDMPCTYIKVSRFDREPITTKNTRCVKADRSDK